MSTERSLGAFIGNTTAFFPTSSRASGIYSINEQNLFLQQNRWPASTNIPVEILVVAGGGGGGGWGGGGGAGGLIYEKQFDLFSGINYNIRVGAGGTRGNNSYTAGGDGGNSVFGPLVAIGGGGGGNYDGNNGRTGGSGGGGGISSSNSTGTGGSGGSGTTNQGFAGGNGGRTPGGNYNGAGGGGGAGGPGGHYNEGNGCNWIGGTGGIGRLIDITGIPVIYAGGGGGHTPGAGPECARGMRSTAQGGGRGGNYYQPSNADDGQAFTGSGGGGSYGISSTGNPTDRDTGAGGSGVVIVKVPSIYVAKFSGGVNFTASTRGGTTLYVIRGTSTVNETARFELATITETTFVSSSPLSIVDFYLWGGGGGSGSQQKTGTGYWTYTQFYVKEGGAGGFVAATYAFTPGTQLLLSVGGGGRGGLIQGSGTRASGGYNGGAQGGNSTNDNGAGGGGYTGVFLNSIGKSQPGAVIIAPGGGGGAGGPGYPGNIWDKACGGGGIGVSDGTGNYGATPYSINGGRAAPGTPNFAGGGGQGGQSQTGDSATNLAGGAGYNGGGWGGGGGGGGGFFGGGGGAGDGTLWSGGGGASGSAFVRGSNILTAPAGITPLLNVTYRSHSFGIQQFGTWGDGTRQGDYDSMRMPVGTTVAQYPGGSVGYGGAFNTTPAQGLDGGNGAIVYRVNGGPWQTVSYTGSDVTITV